MPHELPNNLRFRKNLRELVNMRKFSKLIELLPNACPTSRNENFVNTSKISWKIEVELFRSALFHMKITVCLKYFVNDCRMQKFHNSFFSIWVIFFETKSSHPLANIQTFICIFTTESTTFYFWLQHMQLPRTTFTQ